MIVEVHAEKSKINLNVRYRPRLQVQEKENQRSAEECEDHLGANPPFRFVPRDFEDGLLAWEILQGADKAEPAAAYSSDEGREYHKTSPNNDDTGNDSPVNRVPDESKVQGSEKHRSQYQKQDSS